jgi:hypothetical protein
MKKILTFILLIAGCAQPALAQIPGFTAAEVQTLGDINFTARAQLGHTGPVKDRLLAMAYAMKQVNGATVSSWKGQDPDPGEILGFMATTNFGGVLGSDPYNRSLVDRLANYLGIAVKAVIWPSVTPTGPPAPVVVQPTPAPPATTAGAIEAAVQAAIDAKIAGLQAQVSGLAVRVAALESRSGLGRTIRADSLILGNCKYTDLASQFAICGLNDANIHVESNLSSAQYQNPATHVGMWSMSSDGGMRRIQNGYLTRNCFDDVDPTNGVHYTNCLKKFVDPTREYGQEGFDSRASWSLVRAFPGVAREYTQDVVLFIDPTTKQISWESWQSGWRWAFVTSSCRVCRDQIHPVP